MSMISGLIDELNKSADEWNGSNMFELARMCREAADTIWQLRDDLQRANADNAKLRELCADMLHDAMENICSKAHWCDEKSWQTCNDEKCGNRLYVEMARELGVVE